MPLPKDHPPHIQEDYTPSNPDGTVGTFNTVQEFLEEDDEKFIYKPPSGEHKYGMVQIVGVYHRYAGIGTGSFVGGVAKMTDNRNPNWFPERWIKPTQWWMQDVNKKKYRILSHTDKELTLGGPYEIPNGPYYIIRDSDFAGFEIFECDEDWEPYNDQSHMQSSFNRGMLDGGTKFVYYINKPLNDYYYFKVNTIDLQGNTSIESIKSKTRIWVGIEPPPPDPVPDVSWRGILDSHGTGWVGDSTKTWGNNTIAEQGVANKIYVSIIIGPRKYSIYKVIYNTDKRLYLNISGTPPLGQYRIYEDTSITKPNGGTHVPKKYKDDPNPGVANNIPPRGFGGGVLE